MELFELLTQWREAVNAEPAARPGGWKAAVAADKPAESLFELEGTTLTEPRSAPHALWHCLDHHANDVRELGFPERMRTPEPKPTVLCRSVDGRLEYRGGCWSDGWVGPVRATRKEAAEDAHDYTHPGWREQPRIRDLSNGSGYDLKNSKADWMRRIGSMYPEGWFESGGPVVTYRGGDPLASQVPGGGYDMPIGGPRRERKVVAEKIRLLPAPPKMDRWGYSAYSYADLDVLIYDPETDSLISERELNRQRAAAERDRLRDSMLVADDEDEYDDEYYDDDDDGED